MTNNESNNLVCIGEARNSAEASLIKTFLNDQGIFCFIQGESHRSQLGVMGPYIALNVHVRSSQAKEASALLNKIYDQRSKVSAGQLFPRTSEIVDELAPKKKRIGIVILLTFCITFGTAHFYVGAKRRGLFLLCLECVGIFIGLGSESWSGVVGFSIVGSVVLLDFVGALAILLKSQKGDV